MNVKTAAGVNKFMRNYYSLMNKYLSKHKKDWRAELKRLKKENEKFTKKYKNDKLEQKGFMADKNLDGEPGWVKPTKDGVYVVKEDSDGLFGVYKYGITDDGNPDFDNLISMTTEPYADVDKLAVALARPQSMDFVAPAQIVAMLKEIADDGTEGAPSYEEIFDMCKEYKLSDDEIIEIGIDPDTGDVIEDGSKPDAEDSDDGDDGSDGDDGDSDDGFEPNGNSTQCQHKTEDGDQCKNDAEEGSKYCPLHSKMEKDSMYEEMMQMVAECMPKRADDFGYTPYWDDPFGEHDTYYLLERGGNSYDLYMERDGDAWSYEVIDWDSSDTVAAGDADSPESVLELVKADGFVIAAGRVAADAPRMRCAFVNEDGKRCTRNAKYGNYCWQHRQDKEAGVVKKAEAFDVHMFYDWSYDDVLSWLENADEGTEISGIFDNFWKAECRVKKKGGYSSNYFAPSWAGGSPHDYKSYKTYWSVDGSEKDAYDMAGIITKSLRDENKYYYVNHELRFSARNAKKFQWEYGLGGTYHGSCGDARAEIICINNGGGMNYTDYIWKLYESNDDRWHGNEAMAGGATSVEEAMEMVEESAVECGFAVVLQDYRESMRVFASCRNASCGNRVAYNGTANGWRKLIPGIWQKQYYDNFLEDMEDGFEAECYYEVGNMSGSFGRYKIWKGYDIVDEGRCDTFELALQHCDEFVSDAKSAGRNANSFATAPRVPDEVDIDSNNVDACPLCGDPNFDGKFCNVCGYEEPPEGFDDIVLEDEDSYDEYEQDSAEDETDDTIEFDPDEVQLDKQLEDKANELADNVQDEDDEDEDDEDEYGVEDDEMQFA